MKAAALRDAQRKSLHVRNTGMVVTLDIGDTTNIHPANKEEVGRRLSLWALNKIYGQSDIVYSGPLYSGMQVKGNKATISFTHTDGGLTTKGGPLNSFEIAGADGQFVPAKARINGKQVVVQSDQVDHPTAVRYGWQDTSVPHLFNEAGLPASSFSTE
jgi:sialate O-acetylesterase